MKTRIGKRNVAIGLALILFLFLGEAFYADSMETLNTQYSSEFLGRAVQTASGICPQKRNTRKAPARYLNRKNPIEESPENINEGKELYYKDAKPTACGLCHGVRGNGNGRLAPGLKPAPRNFTCEKTMREISDGQLFWIIQKGSRGTAMPEHKNTLSEKEIWQLIHFLRRFAE